MEKIMTNWQQRAKGGILGAIGFILSPLTWWNDLFINLPLAYAFALPFTLISEKFFLPAMIVGYWITNIVGFMLMHKSAVDIAAKENLEYKKSDFAKDIGWSVFYTSLIVGLVKLEYISVSLPFT